MGIDKPTREMGDKQLPNIIDMERNLSIAANIPTQTICPYNKCLELEQFSVVDYFGDTY